MKACRVCGVIDRYKNGRCKPCSIKSRNKWNEANKDKAKDRTEYLAKWYAEWRKGKSHIELARKNNKRAKKLKATPVWANQFFITEAYELAALRTKMFGFKWHVDHVVPLISDRVCGLHSHTNLSVIPARANLSKSNRYWPNM
jgi:hypothetical protein